MAEHVRGAIKRIQDANQQLNNTLTKSQRKMQQGDKFRRSNLFESILKTKADSHLDDDISYNVDRVEPCPLTSRQLKELVNDQQTQSFSLKVSPMRIQYSFLPVPSPKILNLANIVKISEIMQDFNSINQNQYKTNRMVTIPQSSREGVYITITWIFLWCFTLQYQSESELTFRLNQLRHVLSKLKNDHDYSLGSDLFYLIMEACMQSISFADSQPVYDTMCKLGAVADYKVKLVHFDHQRDSLKQQRSK